MEPHYFFPPARAYRLNRFLFAIKSDDAFRARYVGDPEATMREAGLASEAGAALRNLDRDRLVACGAHPYLVFMAGLRLRMSRDSTSFERF
jgi:Aromatic-ring-opening dioxygenase LigAB, LigA subunit